jgi:hypothetical protein
MCLRAVSEPPAMLIVNPARPAAGGPGSAARRSLDIVA